MAVIAGEHHEKLDGSGYPDRLTARDLSLESRIIAVADVFGALSEDRPYRAGINLEDTLSIMTKFAPHQLDGDCFDALVSRVSSEHESGVFARSCTARASALELCVGACNLRQRELEDSAKERAAESIGRSFFVVRDYLPV